MGKVSVETRKKAIELLSEQEMNDLECDTHRSLRETLVELRAYGIRGWNNYTDDMLLNELECHIDTEEETQFDALVAEFKAQMEAE